MQIPKFPMCKQVTKTLQLSKKVECKYVILTGADSTLFKKREEKTVETPFSIMQSNTTPPQNTGLNITKAESTPL